MSNFIKSSTKYLLIQFLIFEFFTSYICFGFSLLKRSAIPSETCPCIPNIIQQGIICNENYMEEIAEGHLFQGCSEDDEATLFCDHYDEDFALSCRRSPLRRFLPKYVRNSF
ncbi:2254_t:CDS:1 [Scutellospora calospora]|uniref:2254_t:CDS:1 n=1 Tax=Scutellospora calospora TaxID=85575 RepID=A0ACA9KHD8_9GLOM|nr:2254_t:CDS:1 [Scutellospora calospora]